MGGNALPTKGRRIPASEYYPLAVRVCGAFRNVFPGCSAEPVRAYRSKPDFGDLDVLLVADVMPADPRPWIASRFGATEFNPPLTSQRTRASAPLSFGVDGVQVDLLLHPAAEFAGARDYFAYNDLGNLMGRVAHRMGFKYGHRGLRYMVRDGDYLVDELSVTDQMPAAFGFLGYDYARFEEGFDTLLEIFAYAASSPFFDPADYALEGRNHRSRTRDRKRDSYRRFLGWLAQTRVKTGHRAAEASDKARCLEKAWRDFPSFAESYGNAMEEMGRRRETRENFNGRIVGQWSGLSGQALGNLMARCRDQWPGGERDFERFVRESDPGAVQTWVAEILARMKEEAS